MCHNDKDMERWKPVVGCEEWYEVSDQGSVRRIKPGPGARVGHVLKPKTHSNGYPFVMLSIYGKVTSIDVHRLVAKAFVPNPHDKPEVNHKDGNKKNNAVANLEWTTSSHNKIHAVKTGLRKTKLNPDQVVMIRESTDTDSSLAVRFGVSPALVNFIKNRVYYRHVG